MKTSATYGPPGEAPQRRGRLLALFALAVAPYLQTLAYDFTLDDFGWIVNNPEIHSLRNIPRMFVTGIFQGRHFRPLLRSSFALDYAMVGLHPWFYHAVNVALH